jgi:hypothetical protein
MLCLFLTASWSIPVSQYIPVPYISYFVQSLSVILHPHSSVTLLTCALKMFPLFISLALLKAMVSPDGLA